jgi:UDP-N-acetylglucosamine--N-acetylmuramyl-(pentapeptide) pyrophosphoryl-undecaprenol N-acetylglucosamine transferase
MLFGIPFGIIQAFIIMFFTAPDVIISKGGYGSIPVVIAGWMLRIPIFMHESDAVPGMANRILSKFSEKIFVSFPASETEYFPKDKMIEAGNPIREGISSGDKEFGKKQFEITNEKKIVLVLGGSQGSQRINGLMLDVLPEALKEFEIIHQTGKDDYLKIRNEASALVPKEFLKYYHPYFFLDDEEIKNAYAVTDCVVARAGAGTIFEIAAVKKPSILIPLSESAQNHQIKNAYAYASAGACIVVEEGNMTPHFFLEKVRTVLEPGNVEKMGKAAEAFSRPLAGEMIAKYIMDYLI